MEIDLAGRVFDTSPPLGYRLVAWDESMLDTHAETKYLSFRTEIDANVFPCLGELAGCHRLMHEIRHKEGFLPGATWLAVYQPTARSKMEYCGTIQGIRDQARAGRDPESGRHARASLARLGGLLAAQGASSASSSPDSLGPFSRSRHKMPAPSGFISRSALPARGRSTRPSKLHSRKQSASLRGFAGRWQATFCSRDLPAHAPLWWRMTRVFSIPLASPTGDPAHFIALLRKRPGAGRRADDVARVGGVQLSAAGGLRARSGQC